MCSLALQGAADRSWWLFSPFLFLFFSFSAHASPLHQSRVDVNGRSGFLLEHFLNLLFLWGVFLIVFFDKCLRGLFL